MTVFSDEDVSFARYKISNANTRAHMPAIIQSVVLILLSHLRPSDIFSHKLHDLF